MIKDVVKKSIKKYPKLFFLCKKIYSLLKPFTYNRKSSNKTIIFDIYKSLANNEILILCFSGYESYSNVIKSYLLEIFPKKNILIITYKKNYKYDNSITYFVVGMNKYFDLPPHYIWFNINLNINSSIINNHLIKNSLFILDFSLSNISIFNNYKFYIDKVFYLPNDTKFKYYLCRFLFYLELIDFDYFYNNTFRLFKFINKNICLCLPEYSERYNAFVNAYNNKFYMFPGIRKKNAVVGCAFSYKFIAKLAIKSKYNSIVISEDDAQIKINLNDDLTYFCGLINCCKFDYLCGYNVNFSPYTRIYDIFSYKNYDICVINKSVSMVFNIYSKKVLNILSNWNCEKQIVPIDRYLEKRKGLKILMPYPFIVNHNEYLKSSIWDGNNNKNQYEIYLNLSTKVIQNKISKFKRRYWK